MTSPYSRKKIFDIFQGWKYHRYLNCREIESYISHNQNFLYPQLPFSGVLCHPRLYPQCSTIHHFLSHDHPRWMTCLSVFKSISNNLSRSSLVQFPTTVFGHCGYWPSFNVSIFHCRFFLVVSIFQGTLSSYLRKCQMHGMLLLNLGLVKGKQ